MLLSNDCTCALTVMNEQTQNNVNNKIISFKKCIRKPISLYSGSSSCDHFRKRQVVVTTSIVNPRLTCHINSVIKVIPPKLSQVVNYRAMF